MSGFSIENYCVNCNITVGTNVFFSGQRVRVRGGAGRKLQIEYGEGIPADFVGRLVQIHHHR